MTYPKGIINWYLCLREKTDRPFEHPSRVVKAEQTASKEENKSIGERIKKVIQIGKRKKVVLSLLMNGRCDDFL